MFDLANFVEDKMTIVSDPLYSGDAVSQYFEKNQKFINRRSLLSTLSRLRNYERWTLATNYNLIIDVYYAMKIMTLWTVFSFIGRMK